MASNPLSTIERLSLEGYKLLKIKLIENEEIFCILNDARLLTNGMEFNVKLDKKDEDCFVCNSLMEKKIDYSSYLVTNFKSLGDQVQNELSRLNSTNLKGAIEAVIDKAKSSGIILYEKYIKSNVLYDDGFLILKDFCDNQLIHRREPICINTKSIISMEVVDSKYKNLISIPVWNFLLKDLD